MLNVFELEKKWKRYKLRSYIPYIIISISSLVILAITLFVLLLQKKEVKDLEKNIKEEYPLKVETPKTSIKPIPSTEPVIVKKIPVVKPITPTPTPMPKIVPQENRAIAKVQATTPPKPIALKEPENRLEAEQEVEITPQKEEPTIKIKRQKNNQDINDVIKRFNVNHNPALSLFIAKKYYELGEYKKSYNYALITNEINNDIESSWIIFAKSLVKMKKKDKAIQVLQKYISYTGSNRASILLDNIISGKFK